MIRLGLIGAGRWGQRYLQTVARLYPDGSVAITDVSRRTPEEVPGSRLWPYWEDVVAWAGVDGVIIATPPGLHYKMASVALALGVPTLLEKPATMSLRATEGLLHIARAKRTPCKVGHVHLASPAFQRVAKELRGESLKSVTLRGHGNGPRRDYSVLWDWAPHDLSMLFALTGTNSECEVTESDYEGFTFGARWSAALNCAGTTVSLSVGNIFQAKERLLDITCASGKRVVYDDSKTSDQKVRINEEHVVVDPTMPLDLMIKDFVALCQLAKAPGALAHGHATEDLELAVKIAATIEEIQRKAA
jgi:predicted dehydrogenase